MTSGGIPHLAFTVTLAGIAGLYVGSFLNVVVYRTPLGLSVVAPRSFCPNCRHQLTWWENIPMVSWVLLRGRCHTCHQPISIRYPSVELATGVIFALTTWGWHGTVTAAAYCLLAATLISVALIEYGGLRAPLSIAAIGTGLALVVIVIGAGWQHHWRLLFGSVTGSLLALVVIAVLRSFDPDCVDPRGHGRSALLIAGCWIGGLGLDPLVVGVVVWIAVYFCCMLGTWASGRSSQKGGLTSEKVGNAHPLLGTPMVTALAVAMAASLITMG